MLNRFLAAPALACALLCAAASSQAHPFARPPATGFQPVARTFEAGADLVSQAARYLGTNPTGWRSNWCAFGLNRFVLGPLGLRQGTNMAGSFMAFPRTSPHRGALVVQGSGGRAAHVGIVESADAGGIHIISFNWGHRVARGTLRPSQVLAFVDAVPGSRAAAVPWPIRHHVVHLVSLRRHRHHHRRHRR